MAIFAMKDRSVPRDRLFLEEFDGDRKALEGAVDMALRHEGELVIWKISHLGHTFGAIFRTLHRITSLGIPIVSLSDQIEIGPARALDTEDLLTALVGLEADLLEDRTASTVERARQSGRQHGRARAMTPERVEKALEMLGQGARGADVWRAMKEMPGPDISRAAYYAWQKKFDEIEDNNADKRTRND